MGRRYKPSGLLTLRQSEVLLFIIEWAGERGLDIKNLPLDRKLVNAIANAFDIRHQSASQYVTQLQAAGVFGNPSDARLGVVNDKRVELLRVFLKYLDNPHGYVPEYLRRDILAVL